MYARNTIHRDQYTFFKNKLTNLLRRAKRLYYYKVFSRVMRDSSKLWNHINRVIGKGYKVPMESLNTDNNRIVGNEMVNYANTYFVNIANELTNDLPVWQYIETGAPNPHTFSFIPTNELEVGAVIKSLKNKGGGFSDISIVCLKNNFIVFSYIFPV